MLPHRQLLAACRRLRATQQLRAPVADLLTRRRRKCLPRTQQRARLCLYMTTRRLTLRWSLCVPLTMPMLRLLMMR